MSLCFKSCAGKSSDENLHVEGLAYLTDVLRHKEVPKEFTFILIISITVIYIEWSQFYISPVQAAHFESHLAKLQADSSYLLSEEFEVMLYIQSNQTLNILSRQ